jgi:DUF4097 and DUF4098 domain-containing protein YvlB
MRITWKFRTRRRKVGPKRPLARLVLFVIACSSLASAQAGREFHQTFAVSVAQPVVLNIELSEGNLQVTYSREGEVSVSALGQVADDANIPAAFISSQFSVKALGNQIEIREQPSNGTSQNRTKIDYWIAVPYRTEMHSFVKSGKQSITGIMGPVTAETNDGDLKVSYVSKGVVAHAVAGNLDLQVIGEHVEAKTGRGNISCSRAAQGVRAETGDGDISLMVVGTSEAKVSRGIGRIDAGGLRGTLVASTDAGDLRVKAIPHDDWQLSSASGTVRVELPPTSKFDLNALTDSGAFGIGRDDLQKPNAGVRILTQRVNGGGKRIEVRTESGRIVVN